MTKTCSKCGQEKPLETGYHKSKSYRGGYYRQCIECRKRHPSQRSEAQMAKVVRMRERNRAHVYEYLGSHPCVDCGEADIVVLEFDHVRGEKRKNVSQMIHSTYSLSNLDAEIAKCDVVCANCHRRRTAKQQDWEKGA